MTISHTNKAGFSLLELVIYIAIVGILMVMVGPRFMSMFGKAKDSRVKSELKAIRLAVQEYYGDLNQWPTKLIDLVQKPSGEAGARWRRPYLDDLTIKEGNVVVDPWDQPYHYRVTKGGKRSFELYSEGDPEVPGKFDAWEL